MSEEFIREYGYYAKSEGEGEKRKIRKKVEFLAFFFKRCSVNDGDGFVVWFHDEKKIDQNFKEIYRGCSIN